MRTRLADSAWHLVVGGLVGLVVGIGVGFATDLPFAPEAGIVLGVGAAWVMRRHASHESA